MIAFKCHNQNTSKQPDFSQVSGDILLTIHHFTQLHPVALHPFFSLSLFLYPFDLPFYLTQLFLKNILVPVVVAESVKMQTVENTVRVCRSEHQYFYICCQLNEKPNSCGHRIAWSLLMTKRLQTEQENDPEGQS